MKQAEMLGEPEVKAVDSAFMLRAFYVFAILAVLSVGISIAGKWLGRSIVLAGHTEDTTIHEVVIGNNVLTVPANVTRFERSRRDGIAERLDLYLHWPTMTGYTAAARDDFNHVGASRKIIFLSFERQMMSRDMSGRFDPIYRSLITQPGVPGQGGITLYNFTEKSGYVNEVLAVAERGGETPFVARCLSGESAEQSLAPCERDILIGDDLSLSYRFPKELLLGWRALDAAVLTTAAGYLKTGR
ncbi:hypothetical protein [Mesorhizobium sp. ZC-5]|uniref:hypothetical protein n=1 Tax=Mesorhizobium sp. ZC-5 TaxID=2986066 RepID=UPI0021E7952E|nr:hypothetical protein [Mesorhizobium sp. ZC-5]MCV3241303.1 hypothetical protein [Mesorhizobium sp. ZC-5]